MTLIDAFRYPYRGEQWYLRLARLTFVLTIGYFFSIAFVVVGLGYWMTIVEHRLNGDDDLPQFQPRYEGLIATAVSILYSLIFFGITFFAYKVFGEKSNAPTIITAIVTGVVLSLLFLISLIRYAATGS